MLVLRHIREWFAKESKIQPTWMILMKTVETSLVFTYGYVVCEVESA